MLARYYLRKAPLLVPYVAAIILAPMVNVRSSYASASMMDSALDMDLSGFRNYLIIVLVCYVLHGVLLFSAQALRTALVRGVRESLKQDMFDSVMAADDDLVSRPDEGMRIAAFTNDISILEYKYFEAILDALENVISLVAGAAALLTLNTRLAVVVVVGEVLSLGICFLVRFYPVKANRIYVDTLSRFTQNVKDYFSAFQTIRNFIAGSGILRSFSSINDATESSKSEADISLAFADTLTKTCNSILKFVVVGYGAILMMQGEITMGLVYAAYQFCNQIISPMHVLIAKINSISSVGSISGRVLSIANGEKCRTVRARRLPEARGLAIEFCGTSVSFGDRDVLTNISHTFRPGGKYLILGRNGSGKSTLLRLIKKQITNYEGTISVGGCDLRNVSSREIDDRVCYMSENVSLLCDTVRENILLFRDTSEPKLLEAVKRVGLSLPLDRVVRDGERNLSSGETRRIEIARSLVGSSDVILCDEAVSTLDVQTAFSIEEMLLSLSEQTVLFVSHNFSCELLPRYDEIVLIDDGMIVGAGKHEELMASCPPYQRLMQIRNGAK